MPDYIASWKRVEVSISIPAEYAELRVLRHISYSVERCLHFSNRKFH